LLIAITSENPAAQEARGPCPLLAENARNGEELRAFDTEIATIEPCFTFVRGRRDLDDLSARDLVVEDLGCRPELEPARSMAARASPIDSPARSGRPELSASQARQ